MQYKHFCLYVCFNETHETRVNEQYILHLSLLFMHGVVGEFFPLSKLRECRGVFQLKIQTGNLEMMTSQFK